LNGKRRAVDAYSGHSEFRRVESPYVDLNANDRFRNVFLGGFGFVFSTFGLIMTFIRTMSVMTSPASGMYALGTVVGALIMTPVLGLIWYASGSMVFRSQKLRGYGGVDVSSDLLIFAIVVFGAGLFIGVITGMLAILGDALNPNASRAFPIALFILSLIPTTISGFYLRWRSRQLAFRSVDDDELEDAEEDV